VAERDRIQAPRRVPGPVTDGLVVIDKPPGWTSHDVVARCRKVFGQKKVGHAGTLDPDATGVLLVGLGQATRLLRFLTDWPKSYEGQIVFGVATSTLDSSGEVTGRWDMKTLTLAEAEAAAEKLTGAIEQVPPMVSAIKIGGQRLHDLARQGVVVDRPARPVTVTRFDLSEPTEADPGAHGGGPVFDAQVDCSSGTYIRSLAADLGALLAGGAHLRHLRRTAVGPFSLAEAVALDAVGPEHVIPPAAALRGLVHLAVDDSVAAAIGFGKVLDRSELGAVGDGPWAVIGPGGHLLAVYQDHAGGTVKPAVVLRAEPAGGAELAGRAESPGGRAEPDVGGGAEPRGGR
jgi:tRNA pseudouridine55 synthase